MLEDEEAIGQSAATFYKNLLSCQNTPNCEPVIEELLASILRLVTHQQNKDLTSEVTLEEVKKAVLHWMAKVQQGWMVLRGSFTRLVGT